MTNPGPVPGRVAAELRAELARQNRSKRWLAEQTGHSHVTVQRWLRGGHLPLDGLLEVCEALGITVAELFSRVERRQEDTPNGPRRRRADALRPARTAA